MECTINSKVISVPTGEQYHIRCIIALANEGAGVNVPDEEGNTPLMLAVERNHHQYVKELIKAGADVNMKDIKGNTPINLAAIAEASLKLLIEAGADVNIGNGKGALIRAAVEGHEELVKQLINEGADVNDSNKDGQTALIKAAWNHGNIVHLLLAEGADVNIKDQNNSEALHFACFDLPNCNSMEILVRAGADVNNECFFRSDNKKSFGRVHIRHLNLKVILLLSTSCIAHVCFVMYFKYF